MGAFIFKGIFIPLQHNKLHFDFIVRLNTLLEANSSDPGGIPSLNTLGGRRVNQYKS